MKYEYICIRLDLGSLDELNSYSSVGWRVVQMVRNEYEVHHAKYYALLERVIGQ